MKNIVPFVVSAIVTFAFASVFYTHQVLHKQIAIGAEYSADQIVGFYVSNALGLAPSYGAVLTLALGVGFVVAAQVKRILTPLAVMAYPLAGAVAVWAAISIIEFTMAPGGAGAIGGARDAFGLSLQSLAGAAGGLVFNLLRARS